jgi:catechol 2,3-dioxygenase-like lactoylglutathione lyase family enzyme
MIRKMSHATIFVNNQNEALEFYRDKLGFKVHTDAMVGEDFRWLTMCTNDQPDFEIILFEPKPGSTPTTATEPTKNSKQKASSFFHRHPNGPTESKPFSKTIPATGSVSRSHGRIGPLWPALNGLSEASVLITPSSFTPRSSSACAVHRHASMNISTPPPRKS